MAEFLLTHYMWLKAFHIISFIAWMAALFYLPRLYVYHAMAEPGSDKSTTFKVMEYKLLRIIMNPAMIATWLFALLMFWANPDLLSQGWMHVKLTAAVLLSGLHGVYAKWRKDFAADENKRSHKFYRVWNEAPTVLMIVIVFMAVLKPF